MTPRADVRALRPRPPALALLRPSALVALGAAALLAPRGAAAQEGDASGYERATTGTRWLEGDGPRGLRLKVLVEPSNLGGSEVALAEIEFPPGSGGPAPRPHRHGSVEIFYVLSGVLEHVVNGEAHLLGPGEVGIVRPGDDVVHSVWSSEPVRALVVWAPGGEVERIAPLFRSRPLVESGRSGGGAGGDGGS